MLIVDTIMHFKFPMNKRSRYNRITLSILNILDFLTKLEKRTEEIKGTFQEERDIY